MPQPQPNQPPQPLKPNKECCLVSLQKKVWCDFYATCQTGRVCNYLWQLLIEENSTTLAECQKKFYLLCEVDEYPDYYQDFLNHRQGL